MEEYSLNPSLQAILEADFSNIPVSYSIVPMGEGKAHAFFINYFDENLMQKTWRKISNAIAVYFQSTLEEDFGKWNTYIFYKINKEIGKELKYKIENDTFSSRKILVESEISPDNIIAEHILNSNLTIIKSPSVESEFKKNDIICEALDGRTVKNKRRDTSIAEYVLKKIEESLKYRSNEI